MSIGDEFGYHNYIDFQSGSNNYNYMCTINTELIQIKAEDFLNLLVNSAKGIDYV